MYSITMCLLSTMFCNGLPVGTQCQPPDEALIGAAAVLSSLNTDPELPVIAATESKFHPWIESRAGAFGIFQIMPICEQHVNELFVLQLDRKKELDNATIGMLYYEWLNDRYPGKNYLIARLAAWNWGSSRVDRLLEQGWDGRDLSAVPLETRQFIKRFMFYWERCGVH